MASVLELDTPVRGKKQPPAGTVHWLNQCIERGRLEPGYSEPTTLTPGLAAELLRRNDDNRGIRKAKLWQFIVDVASGKWAFNGEPIIISDDGKLNDGQHRCHAVIEANTPIVVQMTFGLPRGTRTTLDQGAGRTAADYFTMDGVKNATVLAAAARLLVAYFKESGRTPGDGSRVSNAEIEPYATDPQMGAAAEFAHKTHKHARRFVAPGIMAMCHYLMSGIDEDDAETYLRQVAVGENIKKSDPAFAVREGLLREKVSRNDKIHLIFRGWNAFRQGRKLDLAKVSGNLPALV